MGVCVLVLKDFVRIPFISKIFIFLIKKNLVKDNLRFVLELKRLILNPITDTFTQRRKSRSLRYTDIVRAMCFVGFFYLYHLAF